MSIAQSALNDLSPDSEWSQGCTELSSSGFGNHTCKLKIIAAKLWNILASRHCEFDFRPKPEEIIRLA